MANKITLSLWQITGVVGIIIGVAATLGLQKLFRGDSSGVAAIPTEIKAITDSLAAENVVLHETLDEISEFLDIYINQRTVIDSTQLESIDFLHQWNIYLERSTDTLRNDVQNMRETAQQFDL